MSIKRQLALFFAALMCMAAAMGVHDSIFNNYLSDTFRLSADARGRLELPRELPGFLVVLMTGVLCMFAVTHVAVFATVVYAAGMIGISLSGPSYSSMLLMMVLGSAGLHLLQPVGASVAIALSHEANRGRRMGQAGALATAGTVLGTGFVWLWFDKATPQYRMGFLCAALLAGLAGMVYWMMHVPHLRQRRAPLVFRKRYALYYVLEFLFGARKQIFITFGFWVLVKVYEGNPKDIARLLMTAALIGIVFKPLAGMAIDRFGERTIMIADGLGLIFVCLGYGYALRLTGDVDTARPIACACFIADDLLFALGSARAVYLSRLTDSPQEINSTLAMGVSINHIASMTLPTLAGAIWVTFGYERVFAGAAGLALVTAMVATLVPRKGAVPARMSAQP